MNEFPNRKYSIIYADPPWKYNSRANRETRFRRGACGHYNLMTMEEIKSLPVPDIAGDDCALFLWTTFPYLEDQIKLFEHWGFSYRTIGFLWVKANPRVWREAYENGIEWGVGPVEFLKKLIFFGVGYYTKSNPEACLLGIKGRMKPVSNKVSNVVIAPRREHSRKPDEVRSGIVELFGDLPRIELFARGSYSGWDVWGNEAK